jgi:hypothetical protein
LLGYSEFKGLYTSEIDENLANRTDMGFVKTILENSSIAKENLKKLKSSRPGTSQDKSNSWLSAEKRKPLFSGRKSRNLEKNEEENENFV